MSETLVQLLVIEDTENNLVCAHEFKYYQVTSPDKKKDIRPIFFKVRKNKIRNKIEPGKGIRELLLPNWYIDQLGLGARRHAEEPIIGSSGGDDTQLQADGESCGCGSSHGGEFVTSAHQGHKQS